MTLSLSKIVLALPMEQAGFALIEKTADTELHFLHLDRMVLHYVLSGSVDIEFPGHPTTRLGPGDFVCIPRGSAHTLSAQRGSDVVRTTCLRELEPADEPINLRFGIAGQPTIKTLSGSLVPRRSMASYTVPFLPEMILLRVGTGTTASFLPPTVCGAALKGPGSGAFAASLMRTLFVQAVRSTMPVSPPVDRADLAAFRFPRITAARLVMERHFQEPWTIAALATEAGMARSTFVAAFTAIIGEAPAARLAAIRLLEGRRMLNGSRSIGEIATSVGYRSQAAFTRAFRRRYGETPTEVRQALRQNWVMD